MSELELGSVISLIMENPELIAQIKRLAENKSDSSPQKTSEATDVNREMPVEVAESVALSRDPVPQKRDKTKGKRSELLHALSPYISEGRQKALETFMTIADILDMMREK